VNLLNLLLKSKKRKPKKVKMVPFLFLILGMIIFLKFFCPLTYILAAKVATMIPKPTISTSKPETPIPMRTTHPGDPTN
jgi:hypothetical protein